MRSVASNSTPNKKSTKRRLKSTMDELKRALEPKQKTNKVFTPNGKDRRRSKGKLRMIT